MASYLKIKNIERITDGGGQEGVLISGTAGFSSAGDAEEFSRKVVELGGLVAPVRKGSGRSFGSTRGFAAGWDAYERRRAAANN